MGKFQIMGWMTTDMGLSGNELVAFAFLWDRTDGGKKVYDGGYTEISAAMGVTIPTVYNVLKKMEAGGMISREGDGKTGNIIVRRKCA